MPSISEPASPLRELSNGNKWNTASCNDIDKYLLTESDDETSESPIKMARWRLLRNKREAISKFLQDHTEEELPDYIDDLRHFASSPGGLIDDEFRAIIWPILAANLVSKTDDNDCDETADSDFESGLSQISETSEDSELNVEDISIEELRNHPEWQQVELDVNRTLKRFPPNITEKHRLTLQEELIPLIVRVLKTNRRYRYYQGFHDVCLTLILVCGVEKALKTCILLAKSGCFNPYLLKTLEESVLKELDLMYVILSRVEPQLERVMRRVELGSLFALSWPLTWFSHSLQQYPQIVRFFDFFLASHPLLPVYVCSTVVIFRKSAILSCEREMPFIHQLLSNMPHELPLDALLSDAKYLARLLKPCLLRGRYLQEYKNQVTTTPRHLTSAIPRYALQFVFVAGAASAAAGYFILSKYSL
ncbi:unnamed protein product [Auanema sp. JU1783]|nr:unnamed protein product [Auanema sp. JU1783]